MSVPLQYAVHAYAWTGRWNNDALELIEKARQFGFDLIEIPLMDIEYVDPPAIRKRLQEVGLGVITSTALQEMQDITSDDEIIRRRGKEYLLRCVEVSAQLGAKSFSGVIYSAMGKKIDTIPGEVYWERASTILREVAVGSHRASCVSQRSEDLSGTERRCIPASSRAAPSYAGCRHDARRRGG